MSRKGKAPGGYQYSLEDIGLPFIFCNSVGTHNDVQTLLHEGGHAFHSIAARDHELLSYRHAPIEFAETASMSMELMGLEELATVYGTEEANRTRRRHLEGLLRILPWIASIDAFQHWVYANPDHDQGERTSRWLEILDRFDPDLDYEGFEDGRANRWTSQGHLFSHPFYYIEYGIAQIAALQVWQAYRRDPSTAVAAYRAGLGLGGSRPLPELFAAAEVEFDVSAAMFTSLVADVEAVLDR
jgi:oligoendopeptidase F